MPTLAPQTTPTRTTAMLRLLIGLIQGVLAWWLLDSRYTPYSGHLAQSWRDSGWFTVAVLLACFAPLILLAEAGRMRGRHLLSYVIATMIALGALAAYDHWSLFTNANEPRAWPSIALLICAGLGVGLVNQLLEHRERGHALYAHYESYFDDSWMRGFQIALALIFALLLWGVLWLGAALFAMIHIQAIILLLGKPWFSAPVLTTAFAAAIHLTDARPTLITGARNLCLTLLSWLLPLVVLLGCGFLASLCITGLTPLWETRFAASLLLGTVAATIMLLNAAYKGGGAENVPALPVRWAGRAAGPMMLILAVLAAYAIAVRVHQYGWTSERVRAAAVAALALAYGAGYAWATFARGPWLRPLERVNITASLITVALLLALLTPIANPARLSVNSQVARLLSGKVDPQEFDFEFLRFDAGRYGADALAALASNADNVQIAELAKQVQAQTSRSGVYYAKRRSTHGAALSRATLYPQGATLPKEFVAAANELNKYESYNCLVDGAPCDIYMLTLGPLGSPAILVRNSRDGKTLENSENDTAFIYGQDATGAWKKLGSVRNLSCPGVTDALRQGQTEPVELVRPSYKDLQAGSIRLPVRIFDNPLAATPPKCVSP